MHYFAIIAIGSRPALPVRRIISLLIACLSAAYCPAQALFSLSTDLTLLHSLKEQQRFWSVGQTLRVQFQVSPTDGPDIWYGYTSAGKFRNDLVATAKDPNTQPARLPFQARCGVSFRHLSIGWKHYLKGQAGAGSGWNGYFCAGFGLVGGKADNRYSTAIDTAIYSLPAGPASGTGMFKRLTLDLALGAEAPLGGGLYLYGEARGWLPTSDYPSRYLLVNEHAPLVGSLSLGVRILFD
ncbi:MAG TPA: hypothetical protein VG870_09995 [Chitinophagaceae bacterium]|nr:hypothetical protein [Chitinophagaceae bacterium]